MCPHSRQNNATGWRLHDTNNRTNKECYEGTKPSEFFLLRNKRGINVVAMTINFRLYGYPERGRNVQLEMDRIVCYLYFLHSGQH